MLAAQIIIGITLILMLTGKAPIYLTAFVGSTIAALAAGVALIPDWAAEGATPIMNLVRAGLHGVLLDMLGILLFIGIMEKVGYLNSLMVAVMKIGKYFGKGPGVATAGGIVAGIIGGFTGFTQPAITGVITGPPAVEMGVEKNRVAGILAHAGHLGNFGGFTHPTIVGVVAAAGIGWGMINAFGAIVALSIFAASLFRVNRMMKKEGAVTKNVDIDFGEVTAPWFIALIPMVVLIVAFAMGVPVIMAGIGSALLVVMMKGFKFVAGEKDMMAGLVRITVPLFATVAFLYMAAVVNYIGIVALITDALGDALRAQPYLILFIVGSVAGLLTQSNGASAPIVIPLVYIVVGPEIGANPLTAAVAAAGGPAIMQYFLTGGPVAALSTVIPIVPGSDLKLANKFQRPSILIGMLVLLIIILLRQLIFG